MTSGDTEEGEAFHRGGKASVGTYGAPRPTAGRPGPWSSVEVSIYRSPAADR